MKYLLKSLTVFTSALMLLSCDGGIKVEETISASPATIDAGVSLASYEINLTSNAAWTAELQGEGNAEVAWVSLSKSKGTGDAKITARVFENKYKDTRKATVVFTTTNGTQSSVVISQQGKDSGADIAELKLRVGSYNLRMSTITETSEDNSWTNRSPRLLVSIQENDFDVFGMQEVSIAQQTWLKTNLSTTYDFFFFSPYSQAGTGDKAQGIAFKKSLFTISDKNFFWASATPETMTTNDTGSSGNFSRGGCCCVLTHKETGIQVFFMNTHACLNREPNNNFASVYVDQEKKYNTSNLPSFFVGDMNAHVDYPAVTTYLTHWKDSYSAAAKRTGGTFTYNGFGSSGTKYRIDYVFYKGSGITINEFCINNALYDGKYASDHFPIYADLTIKK